MNNTQVTFRVINFNNTNAFFAMAWNYSPEHGKVGIWTTGEARFPTYTEAREALDRIAAEEGLSLRWFDGEYTLALYGTLLPLT